MAYRSDTTIFIGPFFEDYRAYINLLLKHAPQMKTRGSTSWQPDIIDGVRSQYLALGFRTHETTAVISVGGFRMMTGKRIVVLSPEEYLGSLLPNTRPQAPPNSSNTPDTEEDVV